MARATRSGERMLGITWHDRSTRADAGLASGGVSGGIRIDVAMFGAANRRDCEIAAFMMPQFGPV